ncbi:GNAT family N-acetyltransferase [Chloroflexota bacterium]
MITSSRIVLRDKTTADAWDDYAWETDPELARLDAAPVLSIPYSHYLSSYTEELLHPYRNSRQFAIDTPDGKHIGNCSYYNIDKFRGETELGIMIGDRDYWDKGYGVEVIDSLIDHIFNWTNLDRIHLKTLDWNTRAHNCFKKCGFTPCGQIERSGYSFVLMEIHRKNWEEQPKLL